MTGYITVNVERDYETVWVSEEPDPDWTFVDAAGHEHRWRGEAVPTVEHVVTGMEWSEDLQEFEEVFELRCRRCGEAVEPRWRTCQREESHYGPTRITGTVTSGHPRFGHLTAAFADGRWVTLEVDGGYLVDALAVEVTDEEILFVGRDLRQPLYAEDGQRAIPRQSWSASGARTREPSKAGAWMRGVGAAGASLWSISAQASTTPTHAAIASTDRTAGSKRTGSGRLGRAALR